MKKNIWKILIIVALVAVLCFTLVACNKDEDEDYAIPSAVTINIEVYDGETLLGTVTAAHLDGVAQEVIDTSTVNDVGTPKEVKYVGYSFKAMLAKANITLPSFTELRYVGTDNYDKTLSISSLDRSYITIGIIEDGNFVEDSKSTTAPRLVTDKNSTSSNDTAKLIAKVILNPVEAVDPNPEEPTDPVDDVYFLNAVIKDLSKDKNNDIKCDDIAYVMHPYNDINYFGYKLSDVLSKMTKVTKSGDIMNFIEGYNKIGLVANAKSGGLEEFFITAEEIGSADYDIIIVKDGDTSRIFSKITDQGRLKTKGIVKLNVYTDDVVSHEITLAWGEYTSDAE